MDRFKEVDSTLPAMISTEEERDILANALRVKTPWKNPDTKKTERTSELHQIYVALIRKAKRGNVMAAKEILDRHLGKVVTDQKMGDNKKDNSFTFNLVFEQPNKKLIDIPISEIEEIKTEE